MIKSELKVLFVHDGPLYFEETTNQYFGVDYTDKIIKRYSYLGSKVTFLMRSRKINSEATKNYSPINSTNFYFIEIPNFKSIKSHFSNKRIAKKIIQSAINDHDLIIIRLPSSAGSIAYNFAKKLNKPILVEFVACVFDALWNYDWRGKLMAHYKLYKYKKLIKNSSHTIYVTNHFLQSRYPSNGKSIGCSDVEMQPLGNSILVNRIERISESKKPLVVGTIAALDAAYKRQSDVIQALGKLKRQGIYIKYKLVGDGNPKSIEKRIIKNKVEDLVEIIGPLSHSVIFSFLKEIDVYIQPSKQEGLTRSLIEAMSEACPCLGSNTGGIPELLQEQCIFKRGSVSQIIQKLKQVNKNWLLKQAEINFEKAKEFQKEILDSQRHEFYRVFLRDYYLL